MYKENESYIAWESARKNFMDKDRQYILSKHHFPSKPSSDGYYHIRLKDNTSKSGYRQHKAKTLEKLYDVVYEYEKGIGGAALETFRDVFEIVENKKLAYVKDADKKKSKQNTVKKDRSEYKRFFEGTEFERKFIQNISKRDIEGICFFNLERYDLRPKAYKSMQDILRSVFNLAFKEYMIGENVFDRADFKQYQNMCIESTSIKDRVHSNEDVDRMIEYCHNKQGKQPDYFPAYALELQIYLGLRRGELPLLMWENVKEKNGYTYLEISRELLRDNTIVNHTKTHKDRMIPLDKKAINLIERLKFQHKRLKLNSIYLFPAKNDNGCITYDTVTGFYYRMLKKLSIPTNRDCMKGTHSFRRNVETDMRNRGINPQTTANFLGHSIQVAETHYYINGYNGEELKKVVNA